MRTRRTVCYAESSFPSEKMERRVVASHAERKKHRLAATEAGRHSVASFLRPPASEPLAAIVIKAGPVASRSAQPSSASTAATDIQSERAAKDIFQLDTAAINAEVMWGLNDVTMHTSFRTAAVSVSLFPLMFPSATAKELQLGKDKVGYTIYCLWPRTFP